MRGLLKNDAVAVTAALTCATLLVGLGLFFGSVGAEGFLVDTHIYISVCGNALVDQGEVCDDGVNIGGYGSTTAGRECNPGCQSFAPYCGDDILQARFSEECDDGNTANDDLCDDHCIVLPPAPHTNIGAPRTGIIPEIPGATEGLISAELQTKVILRGKAYPFSSVSILLDGQKIGSALADSNADFSYTTTQVTAGTASFSFLATDRFGVDSIITTAVFDVVQSAVTTVSNIFLPPSISADPVQVGLGEPVELRGQSVPFARIALLVLGGESGSKSTPLSSQVDEAGDWALQVDTNSLQEGYNTAKASFTLSTSTKSGYGKSISFLIGESTGECGGKPDMNGDSKVNLVDFSIFLLSWNTSESKADYNCDARVNLADFSIMLFQWTG